MKENFQVMLFGMVLSAGAMSLWAFMGLPEMGIGHAFLLTFILTLLVAMLNLFNMATEGLFISGPAGHVGLTGLVIGFGWTGITATFVQAIFTLVYLIALMYLTWDLSRKSRVEIQYIGDRE